MTLVIIELVIDVLFPLRVEKIPSSLLPHPLLPHHQKQPSESFSNQIQTQSPLTTKPYVGFDKLKTFWPFEARHGRFQHVWLSTRGTELWWIHCIIIREIIKFIDDDNYTCWICVRATLDRVFVDWVVSFAKDTKPLLMHQVQRDFLTAGNRMDVLYVDVWTTKAEMRSIIMRWDELWLNWIKSVRVIPSVELIASL